MSKIGQAKILGGIGALLSLLTVVPSIGFIIGLVGLILVFIAVKYIAEETKDHTIFQNYLMNFIFDIIAIGAVIGIMIMAFGISGGMSWVNAMQGKDFTDFSSFWETFGSMVIGCALALLVAWIMLLIGALYLRKSYNSIADHTKVDLFKTTGLVNLIGAATIIIVIGIFIILIARILEIVSYFSLPENLPTAPEPPKPMTP
ncbi:MAG: hypothetical protein H6P94_703 [Thermoplasmatales archaeon]|jgi:uncharacterized membrane protein|nr:hypothetical protein [Thermoplasmatales archaeon]